MPTEPDKTDTPGPDAGESADQVHLELDPSSVENDPSTPVTDLAVDEARLLKQAIEQTRMALCISDPHQEDCPIVLVNQAFVELTGYPREEAVGRNCRFLQGPDSDPAAIQRIRDAMAEETVRVVELRNYRKDGTAFWNALHIGPIYDEDGRLTHFYGSQWDVTDLIEERERTRRGKILAEELQHRSRNLFASLSAIVRLSAAGASDVRSLVKTVTGRLEALGRAHEASITADESSVETTDLHAMLEAILRPYRTDAPARIEISGPAVSLRRDLVTPLGITLHELATNSLKHGALKRDEGTIRIAWTRDAGRVSLDWAETGGPTTAPATDAQGGSGGRIAEAVLAGADGTVEGGFGADGRYATRITFPA